MPPFILSSLLSPSYSNKEEAGMLVSFSKTKTNGDRKLESFPRSFRAAISGARSIPSLSLFKIGVGGLAFLGVLVGMMLAIAFNIFIENPRYIKKAEASGKPNPPEVRLFAAMFGAPALVIGLAWFAATDSPSVHFIVPIIAAAPFGFGMVALFLSTMNYLVDSYVIYAASVLAANSVIR